MKWLTACCFWDVVASSCFSESSSFARQWSKASPIFLITCPSFSLSVNRILSSTIASIISECPDSFFNSSSHFCLPSPRFTSCVSFWSMSLHSLWIESQHFIKCRTTILLSFLDSISWKALNISCSLVIPCALQKSFSSVNFAIKNSGIFGFHVLR